MRNYRDLEVMWLNTCRLASKLPSGGFSSSFPLSLHAQLLTVSLHLHLVMLHIHIHLPRRGLVHCHLCHPVMCQLIISGKVLLPASLLTPVLSLEFPRRARLAVDFLSR